MPSPKDQANVNAGRSCRAREVFPAKTHQVPLLILA